MPPERRLRLVPPAPLRVVDVALFYGERSGGTRTYVDAKRAVLRGRDNVEHHVVVPGARERHADGWHELPSVRANAHNGYRVPVGAAALRDTLARLRPDVVLLHDPFWATARIVAEVRRAGGHVIAVHHSSTALEAAGLPGPDRLWRPALRGWMRHACRGVDAVMAADDAEPDCGRPASLPLRLGVDRAFRPRPGIRRGDRVVFAGRLAREKGLDVLLEAAALSIDRWPLEIVGAGPLADRLAARVRRYGLGERVTFTGHVASPAPLARRFAAASCVVMPGRHETFGLVALEAASSGARVVGCANAPAMDVIGGLGHRFAPGDAPGLARAIAAARSAPRDLVAARRLSERSSWEVCFRTELLTLGDLLAWTHVGSRQRVIAANWPETQAFRLTAGP